MEINELWRQCVSGNIHPDECPSNEEIEEIIERHLNITETKEDDSHE